MEDIEMRISLLSLTLLLLLAASARSQSTPFIRAVEPASGTIGDVFQVQGDNLDEAHVAALYLTDGKVDVKVQIAVQSATLIKFKILPETKAGRFALMVLTAGKNSRLIEEPVKVTIQVEGKPAT
jgi:hypothetical protein